MGTLGTLRVYDSTARTADEVLLTAHRQSDGDPVWFGRELAAVLAPLTITRGIRSYDSPTANGMGCLAAQVVKALKERVGGFYVSKPVPAGDDDGWAYEVYPERLEEGWCGVGKPMLAVRSGSALLWEGPAAKFTKAVAARVERKAR